MNERDLAERNILGVTEYILNKDYLAELPEKEIVFYSEDIPDVKKLNQAVRFFDITQIVLNKNESMRDKLVSVFSAVGNTGSSLLFQIRGTKESVEIRFGIKNPNGNLQATALAQNVLKSSLASNFPGTQISDSPLSAEDLKIKVLDEFSSTKTVATVTDIAGLRTEDDVKGKEFTQGIEKLVDAMHGREYTLFLIADPISLADLKKSRRALESIYSSLVPFSESQYSFGQSESSAISHSIGINVSEMTAKSISESVSHTIGKSYMKSSGTSHTETIGTNESTVDGTSKSTNVNPASCLAIAGAVLGSLAGPGAMIGGAALGGMIGGTLSSSSSTNHSMSRGSSHSNAYSTSETNSQGTTFSDTNGQTNTQSYSFSTGKNETAGSQYTMGKSSNLQVKFENHAVVQMMKRIDKILERYDTCAELGMWNCAIYCIGDRLTSEMLASIYRSIIRGKNSSLETSSITIWNSEKVPNIMAALRHCEHPLVNIGGLNVTPGALISSAELAIEAGLPNRSVPGIPVLECAEFGRTVSIYDNFYKNQIVRSIFLGQIFNMNHEENMTVDLKVNSLASHTFITGSTGSGKSNVVYQILSELKAKGTSFLVIEPAKGEYKNVFSEQLGVRIYGTNPDITPLLRINPFSFPHGNNDASNNIHILEHLDRLIEIFNVCWPMYAAMPAVLKEAIEKSYEDCGWDLTNSINKYEEAWYPTFIDVIRNIRVIIDRSEYDVENKGAYKGSLITRLKSLTNGINGLIFTENEIVNTDLFDKNVIIDLSRVSSLETKSLIMGLLVLKLQEYRMVSSDMNAELKHVTVLEEAHHILKRTNTLQSSESGNLIGKAVEMLSNSIAEMRTYGEGFVIVDQAPGLLDMSAIRNTNTKIIMRLPDKDDRELVGKAANLNDDQIIELAKLPCGVAAVYQNEWIEPVLCKIEHYKTDNTPYTPSCFENYPMLENLNSQCLDIAKLLCKGVRVSSLEEVKEKIKFISLPSSIKVQIIEFLLNPPESPRFTKMSPLIDALIPAVKKAFAKVYETNTDPYTWTEYVDTKIRELDHEIEIECLRDIRQCIITQLVYNELHDEKSYNEWRRSGVK